MYCALAHLAVDFSDSLDVGWVVVDLIANLRCTRADVGVFFRGSNFGYEGEVSMYMFKHLERISVRTAITRNASVPEHVL